MNACEYCYSEYTSASAAATCEDECALEAARQREWERTHPTGAVRRD